MIHSNRMESHAPSRFHVPRALVATVSMSIKAKPNSFKRHPTNRLDVPTSQRVVVSLEEVKDIAASRDLQLTVRELGPLYRIVCRDGKSDKIVGVTSGFIVPMLGLMHCDTLQIFTKGQRGEQGMRVRAGLLGLGLLMGGATFAFGRERGCRKAEILAIDDDDYTHARLVKYYGRFGFVPTVRVTGAKVSDIPHMLVWGGVGTRMDCDVETMLRRWSPAIRNSRLPS